VIYAVTILINAKDEEQVEEHMHRTFGSAWFEIDEFPYGVDEDDLAADLLEEGSDEE